MCVVCVINFSWGHANLACVQLDRENYRGLIGPFPSLWRRRQAWYLTKVTLRWAASFLLTKFNIYNESEELPKESNTYTEIYSVGHSFTSTHGYLVQLRLFITHRDQGFFLGKVDAGYDIFHVCLSLTQEDSIANYHRWLKSDAFEGPPDGLLCCVKGRIVNPTSSGVSLGYSGTYTPMHFEFHLRSGIDRISPMESSFPSERRSNAALTNRWWGITSVVLGVCHRQNFPQNLRGKSHNVWDGMACLEA